MKIQMSTPTRRKVAFFLCAITSLYLTACSTYKVSRLAPVDIHQFEKIQSRKVVFLHQGEDVYRVLAFSISNDTILQVTLSPIDPLDTVLLNEVGEKPWIDKESIVAHAPHYKEDKTFKQYKPRQEATLTREVHIYVSPDASGVQVGRVNLSLGMISEIRSIEKDPTRSFINSYILFNGILGILTIVLLLTKSSCPYVYVHDGEGYVFQGEVFSGAVMQSAERDDYLPLPLLKLKDGEVRVRIANELKERQYVNRAELIGVEHPSGTRVILDAQGAPMLLSVPRTPLSALTAAGEVALQKVARQDSVFYAFDEKDQPQNGLVLRFDNPGGAGRAILTLRAKNSLWFDHLYGSFAEKVGTRYPAFMKHLEKLSPEERARQQQEQDFPLSVYLKSTEGVWKLAGRFPLAGPMGWRDMAIPLDLQGIKGAIELRLETGFLFWEVDYAALDFPQSQPLKAFAIPATFAKDQDGQSWLRALRSDDRAYMVQAAPGMYADLGFRLPEPPSNATVSCFLHVKGYYEHIRDFKQVPNREELAVFRQPHYFDLFSRSEYERLQGISFQHNSLKNDQ